MRRVSVHRSSPGELEGRQTGRTRELEEGWNGRDSPWRSSLPNHNRLRSQSVCHLEAVIMPRCCQHCSAVGDRFLREGAPVELLTDNAMTFSGETFSRFAERWGVRMRLQSAYVPAGNGIVERSHRTIKRIATRTRCLVMEAVYWYNVTPKDDVSASTAPANIIYSYTARIRGVDVTLPPEDAGPSSYKVGDSVWVKIPHG